MTANLPAVLQHPQLPRVAAGVGALAFGFGLELLRRNLLTRLAKPGRATPKLLPAQSIMDLKDALTPQSVRTQKLPKGYEIQERYDREEYRWRYSYMKQMCARS